MIDSRPNLSSASTLAWGEAFALVSPAERSSQQKADLITVDHGAQVRGSGRSRPRPEFPAVGIRSSI